MIRVLRLKLGGMRLVPALPAAWRSVVLCLLILGSSGHIGQALAVSLLVDTNAAPMPAAGRRPAHYATAITPGLRAGVLAINLTIDNPQAGEEDGVITFAVSRTGNLGATATVDYVTLNGSATAGSDYEAASGTLTFGPNVLTQALDVTLLPDTLDEADETFSVVLSNPTCSTGCVITTDPSGEGTILDNDPPPALSINDVAVNEAAGTALFIVTLDAPSGQIVTVDYTTNSGSAIAEQDFTATSGTLTFVPGDDLEPIIVPILDDSLDESDETFNVTLSNPDNATIVDGTGVGTITDNDPLPALSINDVTVNENAGTASFTVSLTPVSGRTVMVQYATSNGTALAGQDYTATNGTLTFTPGDTSETISVPIINDNLDENDETFNVTLSNPANATITDGTGVGTIMDNDALPALAIDDVTVNENAGTASFTVSLTPVSGQAVTVQYATSDGTALAGQDYTAASGMLTFTPGDNLEFIFVTILNDSLDESDETFSVTLSNPTNATIADGTGVGTIMDNDPPPALVINDVTVSESAGTASFTVSLNTASGRAVTVQYATSDGTALAGLDYIPASGALTFTPGDTSETITVTILEDLLDEDNETFNVTLSNPTNATIADGIGVGTITDNDALPALAINDVTVNENAGTASFTVSLNTASGRAVTVQYATSNGTALAGQDYTAAGGMLTFTPGDTSETVTVTILEDLLDEDNETFNVTLSNPTNATIADGTGVGTITDNDPLPNLSIGDINVNEDAGTAGFTVSLTPVSGRTVMVQFATSNGTAEAGTDYTAMSGTLTFAAGATSQAIMVPILDDALDENDETFLVTLSNPSQATIADGQGEGGATIVDNDGTPSLFVNNVTVGEAAGVAMFVVQLSNPSGLNVNVQYATSNGTATAGQDYTATNGSLSFAPGVTQHSVTVPILSDALDEANESFTFTLSNPINASLSGGGNATGSINDDDETPQALPETFSMDEDTTLILDVLANDSDGDGDALTAVITAQPAHAMLTANQDGTFTFTPDRDYFTDSDVFLDRPAITFRYRASDGVNLSSETTVTIHVVDRPDVFLPVAFQDLPCFHGDPYEPNDSPTQAVVLAVGIAVYPNFCGNDSDDYFKLTVTAGRTINIELDQMPAATDLDLYLYNAALQVVAASNTAGPGVSEQITYRTTTGGQLYLRVYPFQAGPDAGRAYRLLWSSNEPIRQISQDRQ